MQTKKMSLDNIKGKLSRNEMKNIMAGRSDSGDNGICPENCSGACVMSDKTEGTCHASTSGKCYCTGATSY